MAASFPTSVKTFTTKTDGAGGDIVYAADVNGLQDEVIAIETELKKATGSVVDHGGLAGLADNDHPQYSLTTHDHAATYLGITAKAADSDKLNGEPASFYLSATPTNIDGWTDVSDTWTYASATTITVPSGAAAIYSIGDKFKLTANSVVLYGYIVGVADTLLTTAGDALTNHTFSAISYSKTTSPIGFPQWFDWTPTVTYAGGFTDPTSRDLLMAKFLIIGRVVFILLRDSIVVGEGDRHSIYYSVPVMPSNINGTAICTSTLLSPSHTITFIQVLDTFRVYLGASMARTGYVYITLNYPI